MHFPTSQDYLSTQTSPSGVLIYDNYEIKRTLLTYKNLSATSVVTDMTIQPSGSETLSAFVLCNKNGCAKHLHQKYPVKPYGSTYPEESAKPAQLQRELYDDTRDFIMCIKLGRSYGD